MRCSTSSEQINDRDSKWTNKRSKSWSRSWSWSYYFQKVKNIKYRNWRMRLFTQSGKNGVIFFVSLHIWFHFHQVENVSALPLFPQSTKKSSNFLHFLICIYIYIYILCYIYIYYVIYIYILHIYIIYYLFIITKWIMFYQCYLFTPDGKTLMIYITFRNCTVSVFPRSGKNEVILCIYLYIWFYFHEMQKYLLFAGSTNNYLIFLVALYFTGAFHFQERGKRFILYTYSKNF